MFSEDLVSYSILKYLRAEKWTILQYHPPGGGAAFPIKFGDGRIVYPDLTAFRQGHILILENKATFDSGDVQKLRAVALDVEACGNVRRYAIARALTKGIKISGNAPIRFGHGYAGVARSPLLGVEQYCLSVDRSVIHIPSVTSENENGGK